MILYFLGWVLKIEGILMILPCAIALIYQELSGLYFLGIGLFCVISGWLMSRKKPSNLLRKRRICLRGAELDCAQYFRRTPILFQR